MGTPLPARFWAKVNKTETCWLWTGAVNRDGYGKTSLGGKFSSTHRAAYLSLVGPIPVGLEIDHLCRVRHCLNPDHMEPVTHEENLRRRPGGSPYATREEAHAAHLERVRAILRGSAA